MAAATAAVAGAVLQALGPIVGGIISAVSAKKQQQRAFSADKAAREEERAFAIKELRVTSKQDIAQAEQIKKFMETLEQQIEAGKVDEEEAITRIQEMTTVAKGKVKRLLDLSIQKGMDEIQTRQSLALKRLEFNLKQAREDVSVSEQREIDRSLREIKEMRRAHDKDAQAIKDTMVRRGIVGAPLAATLSRNTDRLNTAINKVHETSGRITGEFARQLGRITAQAVNEQAALEARAIAEGSSLRSQAGIEQARQDLALTQSGFERTEARREQQRAEKTDIKQALGSLGIA